jgi:hypothetical protein
MAAARAQPRRRRERPGKTEEPPVPSLCSTAKWGPRLQICFSFCCFQLKSLIISTKMQKNPKNAN